MKSGTTYLWQLLNSHPSIFMCVPKEPSYFVEPTQLRAIWPWGWEQCYWKSEEQYIEVFSAGWGCNDIRRSQRTLHRYAPLASGVPEKLHQFNPSASHYLCHARPQLNGRLAIIGTESDGLVSHDRFRLPLKMTLNIVMLAITRCRLMPLFQALGRDQIKSSHV